MSRVKEVLGVAAASAVATLAAATGMTVLGVAPWSAHADDTDYLAVEVCDRLATQNLWEVTRYMSWEHGIDWVPVMIPLAHRAVHQRCPEMVWRLPKPTTPEWRPTRSPASTPAPPDDGHDYYGDEPRFGDELR